MTEYTLIIPYGCMECSSIIIIPEEMEDRCPHCRSEDIKSMEDILAEAIEHRSMMNSFGLDNYEDYE